MNPLLLKSPFYSRIVLLLLMTGLSACKPSGVAPKATFDHLVIFCSSEKAYLELSNVFTPAAKLETEHAEQGTEGRYFLFYNTFLELLYLKDSVKARANEKRFGSAYVNRWRPANTNCPFAFGFTLEPWDSSRTSQHLHTYQSPNAPHDAYYFMSKYNEDGSQPMVYFTGPDRKYKTFKNLDEIETKVEEYKRADVKKYLSHPGKMKQLTSMVLKTPEEVGQDCNFDWLTTIESLKFEKSSGYELILEFDDHVQNKEVQIKDLGLTLKF